MLTLGIILLILFWLKIRSKNSYFYQPRVKDNWSLLNEILMNFQFNAYEREEYRIAYFYFIKNPSKYDGSTIVQDRWLLRGLEPMSMLHDYQWIHAQTLTDYFQSNITYAKHLRKTNMNWFIAWGYCLGLQIISPFHFVLTKKL